MALSQNAGFEWVRIMLAVQTGEMSEQEYGDALAAILDDVHDKQDAFNLAVRIGNIALGGINHVAERMEVQPEAVLSDWAKSWALGAQDS